MDPNHGDHGDMGDIADHGDIDEEEEEYHDQMMVQPDVVIHDDMDDDDDLDDIAEHDEDDEEPEVGPEVGPPRHTISAVNSASKNEHVTQDVDPIATNWIRKTIHE